MRRVWLSAGMLAALASLPAIARMTSAVPAQANPACRAGQTYVEAGNRQDTQAIAGIFAEEVDYTGPDGISRRHRQDIAALYRSYAGHSTVQRRVVHLAPFGRRGCLVEMESSEQGGPYLPNAVAHLEVDWHGKVIRFLPFVLTSRIGWLRNVTAGSGSTPSANHTPSGTKSREVSN